MILAKLNLDEEAQLEFAVQVIGNSNITERKSRFFIEGAEFNIECQAVQVGETITVTVPKLKNILGPGVYNSKLEVIIEGRLFTPLESKIELLPTVDFFVQPVKTVQVAEAVSVQASVKMPLVEAAPKKVRKVRKSKLDKLIDEGFTVLKEGKNSFITKNDKYYGLVTARGPLFTETGFSSVVELSGHLKKLYSKK